MSNIGRKLAENLEAAQAKAKADGFVPKEGTYTFTNGEGAVVSLSLLIVASLLRNEPELAMMGLATLKSRLGAVDMIESVGKRISYAQRPHYIDEAIEKTFKDERETNKELS